MFFAFYSEEYQLRWLISAAQDVVDENADFVDHLTDKDYLRARLFDGVSDVTTSDNLRFLGSIEEIARCWPEDRELIDLSPRIVGSRRIWIRLPGSVQIRRSKLCFAYGRGFDAADSKTTARDAVMDPRCHDNGLG